MNWFYQDNSRKLHFWGKKGPLSQMGTTNVCMKRHYIRVYDFHVLYMHYKLVLQLVLGVQEAPSNVLSVHSLALNP